MDSARAILLAGAVCMLGACHNSATPSAASAPSGPPGAPNTLSSREQHDGWTLLFDGKSMDAWRGYRMDTLPAEWIIADGMITKSRGTTDIVTKRIFTNFEFAIDWKIGPAGNSGLFYRGSETYDHVYWSAPEYQLADDAATPDSKNPLTSAGSVYGFIAPPKGIVKAANEWNSTRIVVNGAHVEHWMNGTKLASYELWSPEWERTLYGVPGDPTKKPLKFAPFRMFGRFTSGFIAIQGDHPGTLALRNIKIREIK